jgi:hypothetical protein
MMGYSSQKVNVNTGEEEEEDCATRFWICAFLFHLCLRLGGL